LLGKVKMPKLGDTATSVLVLSWHVEIGATISEGDPLLTVETDKVDMEVPSPVSGTIVEYLVHPDDEISVGTPIAVVEL
jgi:pyruvate/2-oxoglutarate dehydrogenase complex dihydrolipoamide acyltransferase (E2) component